MDWEIKTKEKFAAMISKIPVFHRRITEEAVTKKSEEIAQSRNSQAVQEEDVISAFFSDVPSPFYSMMVRLLEQTGFDYKKYGFPKWGHNLWSDSEHKLYGRTYPDECVKIFFENFNTFHESGLIRRRW